MSSDQLPYPHVGTEQLLSLWGKGKGRGHSWQSLNTLLWSGRAKILIALESVALKTRPPRKRTEQLQQARGMRQEAILAIPQPPHKADGMTRK